jgi:hypothetical protein
MPNTAGKAKWKVLGRGQFDLADYAKVSAPCIVVHVFPLLMHTRQATNQLVIIPLSKKKANMQLELEVTSDWIKFDGRKFEKVPEAPSPSMSAPSNRKKVEAIGSAKYVVSTDNEQSDVEYTEEEVELNLSDETDDDDGFSSRFAKASNPFDQPAPTSSSSSGMSSLLSSLAGGGGGPEQVASGLEPSRVANTVAQGRDDVHVPSADSHSQSTSEAVSTAQPLVVGKAADAIRVDAQPTDLKPFEAPVNAGLKPSTAASSVPDNNPFGSKSQTPSTSFAEAPPAKVSVRFVFACLLAC